MHTQSNALLQTEVPGSIKAVLLGVSIFLNSKACTKCLHAAVSSFEINYA